MDICAAADEQENDHEEGLEFEDTEHGVLVRLKCFRLRYRGSKGMEVVSRRGFVYFVNADSRVVACEKRG